MRNDVSTRSDDDEPRDQRFEGRALAATFADRETAHDAAKRLHHEGFRRTWLGVTREEQVEDNGMLTEATGRSSGTETMVEENTSAVKRFFLMGSGEQTLYDALVEHGVSESTARGLDGQLPIGSAILTVDGSNHPELAANIIEECGGHVIAGESFADTAGTSGAAAGSTSRTYERGSHALGYGDANATARGQKIDEQKRLQLREERLQIGKQQVSAGEVEVGKRVVEQQQSIDVPVVHEEFFLERRPVTETDAGAAASSEPIGEGERIRIPLMREELAVTKRPVVREEVVLGKRPVTETRSVTETTRREELDTNEADATRSGVRSSGTTTTDPQNRRGSL